MGGTQDTKLSLAISNIGGSEPMSLHAGTRRNHLPVDDGDGIEGPVQSQLHPEGHQEAEAPSDGSLKLGVAGDDPMVCTWHE
jgi:hypothetical protein